DAEHGACRAVARIACRAARAVAAPCVDLADHARAHRDRAAARILDDTDELVADRAAKPGVAACDLEVRVADARQRHANQRLAARHRHRRLDEPGAVIADAQRAHHGSLSATSAASQLCAVSVTVGAYWPAAWVTRYHAACVYMPVIPVIAVHVPVV